MTTPKQPNQTEQLLRRVIAQHQALGRKKIPKEQLAKEVGISRQNLNRYYKHLDPYISGEKFAIELLSGKADEVDDLLSKSMRRADQLESELNNLKASYRKDVEKVEDSYITSLMKGDITLNRVAELESTLEKQAQYNNILNNQVSSLQAEIAVLRAKQLTTSQMPDGIGRAEIIKIETPLDAAFANFAQNNDMDALEKAKRVAIERSVKRVNQLSLLGDARIVLFIDRYLSRFDLFCKSLQYGDTRTAIIVRLPVFNTLELKAVFLSKLQNKNVPVSIHIPVCDSSEVVKAQRTFFFNHVPKYEIAQADKFVVAPNTRDGYQEVISFRIKQGD